MGDQEFFRTEVHEVWVKQNQCLLAVDFLSNLEFQSTEVEVGRFSFILHSHI